MLKNSYTRWITLLLSKNFCVPPFQFYLPFQCTSWYDVCSNSSLSRTWLTCPTHPIFGSVGPAFTTVLHNLRTFSRFNRKWEICIKQEYQQNLLWSQHYLKNITTYYSFSIFDQFCKYHFRKIYKWTIFLEILNIQKP